MNNIIYLIGLVVVVPSADARQAGPSPTWLRGSHRNEFGLPCNPLVQFLEGLDAVQHVTVGSRRQTLSHLIDRARR